RSRRGLVKSTVTRSGSGGSPSKVSRVADQLATKAAPWPGSASVTGALISPFKRVGRNTCAEKVKSPALTSNGGRLLLKAALALSQWITIPNGKPAGDRGPEAKTAARAGPPPDPPRQCFVRDRGCVGPQRCPADRQRHDDGGQEKEAPETPARGGSAARPNRGSPRLRL